MTGNTAIPCGTQVGDFHVAPANTTTLPWSDNTTSFTWTYPYPYVYTWPSGYDDSALRERIAKLEGQIEALTAILAAPKRKTRKRRGC